ncbi:stage II sporulation protein M [Risungbinella massiliensis]|uniref:stage II sporulation protein M n=1 Tax=Risungbinella massiliensis TaxID=1329796 RepID=UPI0005CC8D2F|nr:stage II sporulation protein M [Risungbinella massiliensis]
MKYLFQEFGKGIRAEKKLLFISAGVLLASILIGYFANRQVEEALSMLGVMDQLEKIANQFQTNTNYLYVFSSIFLNNFSVAMVMILVGVLLFFYPVLILSNTGLLVGYVLFVASSKTGSNPFALFGTTILPHGVLEFPAIIVASVLGIRGGLLVIRSLTSLGNQERRAKVMVGWKQYLHRFSPMLFGLTVFLVIAAAIEGLLFYLYT